MKTVSKIFGIFTLIAVIGLAIAACDNGSSSGGSKDSGSKSGGSKDSGNKGGNTNGGPPPLSGSGTEADPYRLTADVWANGSVPSSTSEVWYSFPVTEGTVYRVWWNEQGSIGNNTKTADVVVGARYSFGAYIFGASGLNFSNTSEDSGWTTPQSFIAEQSGAVTLRVIPYGKSASNTGTFGIVYSTLSTRPDVPLILVTLNSVSANGSETQTTTQLTLNFSEPIPFSADYVTLSGVSGASSISKSINSESSSSHLVLNISNVTAGGTLSVAYARVGYDISGSPQQTVIYFNSYVTFNSISANGSATTPTTELILNFSEPVSGLSADDIILSGVSGISKGSLSPSGSRSYRLPINVNFSDGGILTVEVAKTGYNISGSQQVYIYPRPFTQLTENVWTNGNIPSSSGEQWFRFTATASVQQYIHVNFGTLSDLYVQVYDRNGNIVKVQTNLYGSYRYTNVSLVIIGQVYYIRVWPYGSSDRGIYSIAFNTSTTAP